MIVFARGRSAIPTCFQCPAPPGGLGGIRVVTSWQLGYGFECRRERHFLLFRAW